MHVCELGLVVRSFSTRRSLTLLEFRELVPSLLNLDQDLLHQIIDGLALDLLALHRQCASFHLLAVIEHTSLQLRYADGLIL